MNRKDHIKLDQAITFLNSPNVQIEDPEGDYKKGMKLLYSLLGVRAKIPGAKKETDPFKDFINGIRGFLGGSGGSE